jgi:hypothetical protein
MAQRPDRYYFAERELVERAAARAAASPATRSLHLQMAYQYAIIVSRMDELIEELTAAPSPFSH